MGGGALTLTRFTRYRRDGGVGWEETKREGERETERNGEKPKLKVVLIWNSLTQQTACCSLNAEAVY